MKNFSFRIDECPKGLINLQISADENVIFTFSDENTYFCEILTWVNDLGLTIGLDAEIYLNFAKKCTDVVLPLQIFKI